MSPSAKDRERSIERMRTKLIDQFLDAELTELTRFKRFIRSSLKIAVMVGRDFIQNLVKLQAMALAFKTLLSLAPLLAVVFSLLKAFGVHNRMEPALAEALAPLGEKGQEITAHLIGFVNKMSAGALGSVGLVTLFITVLSLMGTIEEAFNHIWRVKSPRKLARRFSDYLSAILVGPVLIFAAVTITATLQNHSIVQALLSLQALGVVILALLRLVPYLTLWGAFTFVYMFIPNTRVQTTIGARRRLGRGDPMADGGVGLCSFCRLFDSLLCDLFELRDSLAFSPLASCRLGYRIAGRASNIRAPAHSLFSRRTGYVGAER